MMLKTVLLSVKTRFDFLRTLVTNITENYLKHKSKKWKQKVEIETGKTVFVCYFYSMIFAFLKRLRKVVFVPTPTAWAISNCV